jgi:hypothetical protein
VPTVTEAEGEGVRKLSVAAIGLTVCVTVLSVVVLGLYVPSPE